MNSESVDTNDFSHSKSEFDPSFSRAGKWTQEEEDFAKKLILEFEAGTARDCEDGCTLRAFLAKRLNCSAMRVSKKFAGKVNGKHIFVKSKDGTANATLKEAEKLLQNPSRRRRNSTKRPHSPADDSSVECKKSRPNEVEFSGDSVVVSSLTTSTTGDDDSARSVDKANTDRPAVSRSATDQLIWMLDNELPSEVEEVQANDEEADEWRSILTSIGSKDGEGGLGSKDHLRAAFRRGSGGSSLSDGSQSMSSSATSHSSSKEALNAHLSRYTSGAIYETPHLSQYHPHAMTDGPPLSAAPMIGDTPIDVLRSTLSYGSMFF